MVFFSSACAGDVKIFEGRKSSGHIYSGREKWRKWFRKATVHTVMKVQLKAAGDLSIFLYIHNVVIFCVMPRFWKVENRRGIFTLICFNDNYSLSPPFNYICFFLRLHYFMLCCLRYFLLFRFSPHPSPGSRSWGGAVVAFVRIRLILIRTSRVFILYYHSALWRNKPSL